MGDWVEITTPYLDRHNDFLQIYAKRQDGGFILTDDGYTVADLYRTGANKAAADLLSRVRLGQTEQGSFVVALVISIPSEDCDLPIERRMTRRLIEALDAVRSATESTVAGDGDAFARLVDKGISANLCEALDRMISPFPTLDVGVTWARTRPMKPAERIVGLPRDR